MMQTLYLVDGSNYLFRAYHAMPNLTNNHGMPTGAIYGVVNMLRRLMHEYQPGLAAVVFDAKGPTFREEMYPDYKGDRERMPDDLSVQIPYLHQLIQALGFPVLIESGVEADDVLGTLATQAQAAGLSVRIFSGDKDMAQLVNDDVWIIDTMHNVRLDEQGVIDKFKVKPNQIIDYLTLMGDKVDNVPGVPKVGPKTAAKWLAEYTDLDNLTENADKIKGKVGENLRDALSYLPLSRDLVTIRCQLKLDYHAEQLQLKLPEQDELLKLYQHLSFKTWMAEILEAQQDQGLSEQPAYQTILTQTDFDTWLEKLHAAPLFAFDTETTSLDYSLANIVGVSFTVEAGEAAYIPLAHDYLGAPEQLNREAVLAQLKPLLEDPKQFKVGQNLKYDAHVLRNHGIALQGIQHDTMMASHVLDSNGRHDMDTLALKYLGRRTTHYQDIAGKGAKQKTFNQVPIEDAAPYAAEDAEVTWCLHQYLQPELAKQPQLQSVYEQLEVPLLPVLLDIEARGVQIDASLLQQQSQYLEKELIGLTDQAYDLAGQAFNLSSPKQLQQILFEKMELPILKKTPKGQPSTSESVLQELAEDHELPRLIIQHRSLAKLKSTYTDKLPKQINPKTGRIHTSYHQSGTATGRLSSSDPNLQNIPVRSELGRQIRQAFIAPAGYCLLAADYSQVELRIMAELSADPILLNAFEKNIDIHRATAAEVFNVNSEQVTTDQRRSAKAINFGLIYGMSAFGLAKQLRIGRDTAQDYIDRYFERYVGVKQYMDDIRIKAAEQGYVETAFGRRLYLLDINASNRQRRQYAERTAINAPMQGTAADVIKRAMIDLHQQLKHSKLSINMIMQVHDELVFEVAKQDKQAASKLISQTMSQAGAAVLHRVELTVEVGSGHNWDEAH